MENYIKLHAMHTKMKMSLILVKGKGPGYLFGIHLVLLQNVIELYKLNVLVY